MNLQILIAIILLIGFGLLLVVLISTINNTYKKIAGPNQVSSFENRLLLVADYFMDIEITRYDNYIKFLEHHKNYSVLKPLLVAESAVEVIWNNFHKIAFYLLNLTKPHHNSVALKPQEPPTTKQNGATVNKYSKPEPAPNSPSPILETSPEDKFTSKENQLIEAMQKATRSDKLYIALELGDLYGIMHQPEDQHELYLWVLENSEGQIKQAAKDRIIAL